MMMDDVHAQFHSPYTQGDLEKLSQAGMILSVCPVEAYMSDIVQTSKCSTIYCCSSS